MRRKPWPIILLSLLYLSFPFFNLLSAYIRYRHELSLIDLLQNLFFNPLNRMTTFNMFVPGFIAAFAIYKVRKWSFPVVVVSILWLAVNTIREYSPDLGMWTVMIGIIIPTIINVVLASYILIPNVYAVYRDSMIRWWERDSRYIYRTPVKIRFSVAKVVDEATEVADTTAVDEVNVIDATGEILNISKGGSFVESATEISIDSKLLLMFTILDIPLEIKAKIGHRRGGDVWGYGVQFINLTFEDQKKLKTLMNNFHTSKTPLVNPMPDWKKDFKSWWQELIKTGKGLTPNLPENHNQKK